jgi:Fungal specific transcription factor domain
MLLNLSQADTSELIHHFDCTVANLISFPRSGTTNPFFSNVLPLVPDSRLVRSAVESVASAHLAVLGPGSQFDAQRLQSRTLGLLAQELSQGEPSSVTGEKLLAATLLLIYYEVRYSHFCHGHC